MRGTSVFIVILGLVSGSVIGWATDQQARPVTTAPTTMDDVLAALRADLQSDRAEVIAMNVQLTGEQAAAFRPLLDEYQKEQDAIMDEQLKGIQRYIETFEQLDDAGALALINAHFDRDVKMVALRQKWLPRFQAAIGTKAAVRVMQIDRRISFAHQVRFTSRIPLAH